MTKILLISEDTIKTHTILNDNIFGKSLAPTIIATQDVDLQRVLGSCLYKEILAMVEDGRIRNAYYAPYKTLLDDYITNYLLYQTLANLIPIISTKITNMGLVTTSDEHVTNLSQSERDIVVGQYQKYADAYCKDLQDYLKANKDNFKEFYCCDGELNSSATTGLFLGGSRGRKLI